jgi:hypothetical protein
MCVGEAPPVLFFHQGKLQVPPLRFAPVGMTKFKAVTYLDLGGDGWTESPLQQPPRFRLPAFS